MLLCVIGLVEYYKRDTSMSILPSIDTSQYTTPLSVLFDDSVSQVTTAQSVEKISRYDRPNVAAEDDDTPKVDLNNYYSNVQPPYAEINGDLESSLVQASENFNNAIMQALENGYSPHDAVNVQKAKVAYQALMKAETSTFELFV